jgi:hypothetical protein
MATNKPTESIDDKAFQALEEALKIDFDDLATETPSKDASEARASEPAGLAPNKTQEKTANRPVSGEAARSASADQAPKTPAFTPANDGSRKTPAAILKTLDVRSGRASIRMAILMSALWVVGGLGVANLLYAPGIWQIRSVADLVALPGAIGMVVAIVMPIMLFFAFAIMVSRAQELRSAARTMAEVALRLSEPETVASDRIMSVGQAVRREVSAMNEGIERTIARATELETLVHSEVNALERSYSDNEMRVRTLVQELGAEREAIVSHAERVRSSISGAHEQLKDELASASDNITQRLATSGRHADGEIRQRDADDRRHAVGPHRQPAVDAELVRSRTRQRVRQPPRPAHQEHRFTRP